mmetsp:Transcript_58768/g.164912  ORF Transcript_58768/g.164912 Transcript_58768/m.164912 type:complete len:191 (-) Transcript_58768:166-738(-)
MATIRASPAGFPEASRVADVLGSWPRSPLAAQRGGRNRAHKTKLCRYFAAGWCMHGQACNFAHGTRELQLRPDTCGGRLGPLRGPVRGQAPGMDVPASMVSQLEWMQRHVEMLQETVRMLARMQAPGPPSDSSRSTEAGDDWGGAASDSGDSEEDCDYAHEFWGEEAEADRGTSRLWPTRPPPGLTRMAQ